MLQNPGNFLMNLNPHTQSRSQEAEEGSRGRQSNSKPYWGYVKSDWLTTYTLFGYQVNNEHLCIKFNLSNFLCSKPPAFSLKSCPPPPTETTLLFTISRALVILVIVWYIRGQSGTMGCFITKSSRNKLESWFPAAALNPKPLDTNYIE